MLRKRIDGGVLRILLLGCGGAGDRCDDGVAGIGVHLEELAQHGVGVEADELRVGADVGTPEDPRRPVRHVVVFERFEERELDLGLLGDRDEIDLPRFTLLAQPGAETLRHGAYLSGYNHATRVAVATC